MKAHPESNDEARIGAHSHSSLWGNGSGARDSGFGIFGV
jgi:hypothetical protein